MEQSPPDRVEHLAANVRAEVARKRITQQAIAEHLGLDQRAVSRRLLGRVEWSAVQVACLAELLEVELSALLVPPTELANTS